MVQIWGFPIRGGFQQGDRSVLRNIKSLQCKVLVKFTFLSVYQDFTNFNSYLIDNDLPILGNYTNSQFLYNSIELYISFLIL